MIIGKQRNFLVVFSLGLFRVNGTLRYLKTDAKNPAKLNKVPQVAWFYIPEDERKWP